MNLRKQVMAVLGAVSVTLTSGQAMAQTPATTNVVLVHGAWADGSGWKAVYDILVADGYRVSIVQNPLTSLAADVAATDRVLDRQGGPTILVGHSYGGAVITEAGDHPNVAALVYVAAFAPDIGESTFGLLAGGPQPPIEVTTDGFAFFIREAFIAGFASGLDPVLAAFLADAQIPISVNEAGAAPLTIAAWRDHPSWYVLANGDHIIPPEAQRQMATRAGATIIEVPGGHIGWVVDDAAAVADAIKVAAAAVAP